MAVEEKSENGLENFIARPLSDWKQHRTVVESSVMRFCCSMQYDCTSLTRRSTRTPSFAGICRCACHKFGLIYKKYVKIYISK
jgi:hypothetical protein